MSILSKNAMMIKPYTAGEQPQDKNYVKLNTNENPFAPSPRVNEALKIIDYTQLKLYPDPESTRLIKAIAQVEGVEPQNVFVGNGSDEVLALLFRAMFNSDSAAVAFADVTYSFYPVYCDLFGINYNKLKLDQNFNLTASDYINLNDSAGGIVIANPNAPTSIAVKNEAIQEIIAANPNTPVIIDEAYVDFAPKGTSCMPLVKTFNNVAVVKTFSKSYALAGMRCGYCVADSKIIEGLNKIKNSFNSYPLDRICQAVCEASVLDREYFNAKIADVIIEREFVAEKLRSLGCDVAESGANFLFVQVDDGENIYKKLKENGILVRFFNSPRLLDRIRITVGTWEQNLALVKAMQQLIQL